MFLAWQIVTDVLGGFWYWRPKQVLDAKCGINFAVSGKKLIDCIKVAYRYHAPASLPLS